MAEIKQYIDRVSPQGQLGVRATADSFGAPIARAKMAQAEAMVGFGNGLERLGQGAAHIGRELQAAQETADRNMGTMWANNNAFKQMYSAAQDIEQAKLTANPADPNFKDFAKTTADTFRENALKLNEDAPNDHARDAYTHLIDNATLHVYQQAIGVQANLAGEYSKKQAVEAESKAIDLVTANPSNETYNMAVTQQEAAIDALNLPGADKIAWKLRTRNELAKATLTSIAKTNPGVLLQPLGGGKVRSSNVTLSGSDAKALTDAANSLGIDPAHLGAIMSFETGGTLKTNKKNPANGRFGLIQFGPNEAAQYGASETQTFAEQMGAVTRYLTDRGVRPGDDLLTLYKIVNGGNRNVPGTASDRRAGGTSTIDDYVSRIQREHLPVAQRLLSSDPQAVLDSIGTKTVDPMGTDHILTADHTSLAAWKDLTSDQKIAVVRMAESEVSSGSNSAVAESKRAIQDRIAMMEQGKVPVDLNAPQFQPDYIRRVHGDQADRIIGLLDYAKKLATAAAIVEKLPLEEATKMIEAMKPEGGDGYAEQLQSYHKWRAARSDRIRELEGQARTAENEAQRDMHFALDDAGKSIISGNPAVLDDPKFSLDNLTKVLGKVDGQHAREGLEKLNATKEASLKIDTMPVEQVADLMKGGQNLPVNGAAQTSEMYAALQKQFAAVVAARDKDPAQWMVDHQIGGAGSLEGDLTEAMKRRITAVNIMAQDYKVDAPLLTENEATSFIDNLKKQKGGPTAQMMMLGQIRAAFPPGGEGFDKFTKQISKKDAIVGQAAEFTTLAGEVNGFTGRDVARAILAGQAAMDPEWLGSEGSSIRAQKPDYNTLRGHFQTAMGGVSFGNNASGNSRNLDNTFKAVLAVAAQMAFQEGKTLDTIDNDHIEKAVDVVTGGVVKISNHWWNKGSKVTMPWGYPGSQGDFEFEFKARRTAALRAAGLTGGAFDSPDSYGVATVDNGVYQLMLGDQYLNGKDDKPVVIDFNQPSKP